MEDGVRLKVRTSSAIEMLTGGNCAARRVPSILDISSCTCNASSSLDCAKVPCLNAQSISEVRIIN